MDVFMTALLISCCFSMVWMICATTAWVVRERRQRRRQAPPDPWLDAFSPMDVSSCGPGGGHPRFSSSDTTSPSDPGRGEADLFTPGNEVGGLPSRRPTCG